MRTLLILILLASQAHAETIRNDHGGQVHAYWFKNIQMQVHGEQARIDGFCGSACTLYLKRACATPRAVLAFHAASTPEGTKMLWAGYSGKVRAYVAANGGLTPKLIIARGRTAQKLIGPC